MSSWGEQVEDAARAAPRRYVPPHLRGGGGAPPPPPPGAGVGGGAYGVPYTRGHGSYGAPSSPPFNNSRPYSAPVPRRGGYGGGFSGGRGGFETGGSRPIEDDPFKAEESRRKEVDALFVEGSAGINFEAYEDIPIETSGKNVPPQINTFEEIQLPPALLANIRRCKYTRPTPVQKQAIPIGLANRDLMACAQTGSGKTAAFCFPILAQILNSDFQPSGRTYGRKALPVALILSPTRELSSQIYDECRKFTYQSGVRPVVVYGGAPVVNQLRELEKGCDVLVATPGRLNDLMERARVSLASIRHLALDEADRMLDMGFEPQIRRIVEGEDMPPTGQRQTLMFSATFPKEIQRLAADFLHDYVFLTVGRVGSSTDLIVQNVMYVEQESKKEILLDLLTTVEGLTLVFVETKRGADQLEDFLSRNQLAATSIHGDRSQSEREAALRNFRSGRVRILVATDVAARGLDIPHVTHVINYDLPTDIDDYVHRIGRTGRAGKKGLATGFFCEKDAGISKSLMEVLGETNQEVPGWLRNFAQRSAPYGAKKRSTGGRFGGRDFRKDYGNNHYGGGGGGGGGGYGGGYGAPGGGYGAPAQYSAPPQYGGYGNAGGYPTQYQSAWD